MYILPFNNLNTPTKKHKKITERILFFQFENLSICQISHFLIYIQGF